jgi:hypothetical protein
MQPPAHHLPPVTPAIGDGAVTERPRLVDIAIVATGLVIFVCGLLATSNWLVVGGVAVAALGIVASILTVARRVRGAMAGPQGEASSAGAHGDPPSDHQV